MNKRLTVAIAIGAVLFTAIGFTVFPWASRAKVKAGEPATGYLEGTEFSIAPKIAGRVQEVLVKEGDRVEAGQIVARLESRELAEQLNQAKATLVQAQYGHTLTADTVDRQVDQAKAVLDAARAKLDGLKNGARPQEIGQARAAVDQAQTAYDNAKLNLDRTVKLFESGAASTKLRDDAQSATDAAQATLNMAKEKLSLIEAGARQEEIDAAQAQVDQAAASLQLAVASRIQVPLKAAVTDQAQATVDAAQAMVDNTVIRAPQKGVVTAKLVQAGEMVAAGLPIVTVVDIDTVWVKANVPEEQVTKLKQDQEISVSVEGLENRLTGKLTWISASADFATKKASHDMGDFDRKTFGIKVELPNPEGILKQGMTAKVYLPAGTTGSSR
ncbi:HlyD family efflux transporter periplasmic adaptor subunit [Heliobacterium gestii]|uniref:HlyD family efflux transporter periplasmic adaptor subunit n=1 Tax=Heliomicrobium gestii TaxID=2699 RepID=A0A845LBE0_HELGE|nr:efflux RND transporter periplasmic adaptor subunit [Heliomicrobium gestii]MBM7867714.1 HlyD family secretion protein [Heliomicrobium gestii]MZP44107.1 HlyD family efflux transporter periplasmic adaptor subunit [Heliomicrobium gestii]